MTTYENNSRYTNIGDFLPVTAISLHLMPRTISTNLARIDVDEEVFAMVMDGEKPMPVVHHGHRATMLVPVSMSSMWNMAGMAMLVARIEHIIGHGDLSPALRSRWAELLRKAREMSAGTGIWAVDTDTFDGMTPEDFNGPGRHVACSPAETPSNE